MELEPGQSAPETEEVRYRSAVEQLAMPVIVHIGGTITFATGAAAELVGFADVGDILGRSLLDFVHADDHERIIAELIRVEAGESSARERCRIVHADGRVLWVEAAGTPYRLDGQDCSLVVIEDVTARLEAEERLRTSELRHRTLVQNGADIVAIVSEEGELRYASPAVERVLGLAPDELVGTSAADWIHPLDQFTFHSLLRALSVAVDGETTTVTLRLRHRDGTWRHLEAVTTAERYNPAVGGVVVNARDVTERIAVAADLRRRALHDPLTGLANRTLVEERIREAVASGPAAVVVVDLNRFKDINDSLGHATGDLVLTEVSERLRRTVRCGDTVGRLGGDEFVVVLTEGGRPDDVMATVQRLLQALDHPVDLGAHRFRLSAAAGIALSPDHGSTGDELLRAADAAMYRAKRDRTGAVVFDEHDRRSSAERLTLSTELVDAIEHGQFTLHYQPKVDLRHHRTVGVEALLRWQHPERGMVPPDAFLPVAEDTGLIQPITRWVLDAAIAQAAAWHRAGHDLTVAVNLSPSSLQDPDFVVHVRTLLAGHRLPADRLVLEVTERTVMADVETALAMMRELTGLGVTFSVDDFGTGYSSLTYLRMLPVAELKIDRSFIGDCIAAMDYDIVEMIIGLGRRLGLRVVAEGIESAESAAYLRGADCDLGQGYHLGRPVPVDQLELEPPGKAHLHLVS